MRLLYGYDQVLPSTGADAEQVFSTVAALSRQGVKVTLRVPKPTAWPSKSGEDLKAYYGVIGDFEVEEADTLRGPGRATEKLRHALDTTSDRAKGYDLVYSRHLSVLTAATARGLRTAYETYRPWPDQYLGLSLLLRQLFKREHALGAILHSELAADAFLRAGVPPEKVLVAHNGFEPSRMAPRLSREEAREKLGLAQRGPLVVYAGRIDKDKGLDSVVALARRLPQVRFLLVGSRGPDQPFERSVRGVPNLSFVPWQPFAATIPYLYAADALLIPPSLSPLKTHGSTVLPLKVFQYLAAGRPIVAPLAPDTRELLRDGENAVLVPPHDETAAAAGLLAAVTSPELWERVSAGALKTALDLTWDARAVRLVRFLESRLGA